MAAITVTAVVSIVASVTVAVVIVVTVMLVTRASRRISSIVGAVGVRGLLRRDVSLVVMVIIGAGVVVVVAVVAVSQCDLIPGGRLGSRSVSVGEGADGLVVTVLVLDVIVSMCVLGHDIGDEQGRGELGVHFRL